MQTKCMLALDAVNPDTPSRLAFCCPLKPLWCYRLASSVVISSQVTPFSAINTMAW